MAQRGSPPHAALPRPAPPPPLQPPRSGLPQARRAGRAQRSPGYLSAAERSKLPQRARPRRPPRLTNGRRAPVTRRASQAGRSPAEPSSRAAGEEEEEEKKEEAPERAPLRSRRRAPRG